MRKKKGMVYLNLLLSKRTIAFLEKLAEVFGMSVDDVIARILETELKKREHNPGKSVKKLAADHIKRKKLSHPKR